MKNILLVEDEIAHVALVQRAFRAYQKESFKLLIAHSLKEAIDICTTQTLSLAIVDWKLPDGNGLDFLKQIHQANQNFPIILMTSHGNEKVAVDSMKLGALDYVVKSEVVFSTMPLLSERVLSEWEQIIARKRAESHIQMLSQELMKTQEIERQKISRELHDNIAQNLSSVKMGIELIAFELDDSHNSEAIEKLNTFTKTLKQSIQFIREMAYELNPSGLDQLGLVKRYMYSVN